MPSSPLVDAGPAQATPGPPSSSPPTASDGPDDLSLPPSCTDQPLHVPRPRSLDPDPHDLYQPLYYSHPPPSLLSDDPSTPTLQHFTPGPCLPIRPDDADPLTRTTCMADPLFPLTIDDSSPVVRYSPFADTFGAPNTAQGWNPFYTDSGFATVDAGAGSAIGPAIGNGTGLHLTACDGAVLEIDWTGEHRAAFSSFHVSCRLQASVLPLSIHPICDALALPRTRARGVRARC